MHEITVAELQQLFLDGKAPKLIDVRESDEFDYCHLPGAVLAPLSELAKHLHEFDSKEPVVVYCHHGIRSMQAIRYANTKYPDAPLYNLKGGIHRWAQKIDNQMPIY